MKLPSSIATSLLARPIADATSDPKSTAPPSPRVTAQAPTGLTERAKAFLASEVRNVGTHAVTRAYLARRLDSFGGAPGVKSAVVARTFVDVLDATSTPKAVVAYTKKFAQLLESADTTVYLKKLNQSRGNVWEITLAHCKGDRARALELMGVLFQDLTLTGGHVEWAIDRVQTQRAKYNVMALTQAIDRVRTAPFPPLMENIAPERGYHFWSMAYAASEMQQRLPGADGRLAPFFFNTFYEYLSDEGLLEGVPVRNEGYSLKNSFAWAKEVLRPRDPKTVDAVQHEEDLKDVYLGYAGASFGAGRPARPFDEVQALFAGDPAGFIRYELFPSQRLQLENPATVVADERLSRAIEKLPSKRFKAIDTTEPVPFDSASIVAQMKDSRVEVAQPRTLGDIAHVMSGLARHSNGNEYGLLLYQDTGGGLRTFVQKGIPFVGAVNPERFLVEPSGKRLVLIGTLAHTHPHSPDASKDDEEHIASLQKFSRDTHLPYLQRYSLISRRDDGQMLFDDKQSYHLPLSAMGRPWQEVLFSKAKL